MPIISYRKKRVLQYNIEFPVSCNNLQEEEQVGLPSRSPVMQIALQYDLSLPGTSGVRSIRPMTTSRNKNLYLDSCSSSPLSSGQVTLSVTPDSQPYCNQIDLHAFQSVLFNDFTPNDSIEG